MNFHKTIGFLATLLLVLGIGVPDSFAQEEVKSLSLTVSPRTLRDSTTANSNVVTVTARLTVNLAAAAATGGQDVTVTVTVSPDGTTGNLNSDNVSYTATDPGASTVSVVENVTRGTASVPIEFTMSHDDDFMDEEITVTATVAAADAVGDNDLVKTAKITVTDHSASLARNAVSARGFQVHLTHPTGTATARSGKDAVKVQLRRKRGLASEFGAFTSIEVALRNRNAKGDADMPDEDLYSLTLDNPATSNALGTLALPRVRTDQLTGTVTPGTGTTLNTANTKAFYTRGSDYDVLEFRFHPLTGGNYNKLYALVVFNGATAATQIDLSLENDLILSNLDTDISIYPPSPGDFPGQMVGNGRTVKLDAGAPANNIVTGIGIEIDDAAITTGSTDDIDTLLGADATAGVGQKIKISVSMTDFDEHSVVLQILGRDERTFQDNDGNAVTVTGPNQVITGHTFKAIGALDVLKAVSQGNAVVVEVPVKANQFKRKANVAAHPTDKSIKKNGFYEDDEVIVQVRAQVKDRAGNPGNQTVLSPPFVLDSRPPKVTLTYPKPSGTDSTRFTAATTQDYTFLDGGGGTVDLKPLNFKVDERTTEVYVVINEDTITVGSDEAMPLAEVDAGYDLTKDGGFELKNPTKPKNNKHPVDDSKQGGKAVKLQVVAKDRIGNVGKATPDGGDAIFDATAPVVTIIYPTNAILEEDAALGNKIGGDDRTQDPIFSVNEATDSILVRYTSSERTLDVAVLDRKVNENMIVQFLGDQELVEGEAYDLQIYARDLAGHVGISDADAETDGAQPEEDLIFEPGLMNPQATKFAIVTQVRTGANNAFTKEDSVVAGQSVQLTITASDANLNNRAAVAYRKGVTVIAMDSDGNQMSSASFSGNKGVKDNKDGSASLAGASWDAGVFENVLVIAEKAGDLTIAVKELDADGVAVVTGEASIHVDAANFQQFNIAILENNQEVDDIRGAFQLSVKPADEFGNVSVKAYKGEALADTLDLLDSRMPDDTTLSYTRGIYAEYNSWPALSPPLPSVALPVSERGRIFTSEVPVGQSVWIEVTVANRRLDSEDKTSINITSDETFDIKSALMPKLTLWVPEVDGDQAGNDVVIPADDDITVTVRAEGFEAGSMITFTKNGTMMDPVTADGDGNAPLMITMAEAGSVMVSATDGRYRAPETGDLSITFTEEPDEPTRMVFNTEADGSGDPVYLINLTDNTVGLDDYELFRAAWGKMKGDDINGDGTADDADVQIFLQSDIVPVDAPDGEVNLDDYEEFITSWNKIAANGPASKPIVLLPGINENAEFSLSLGSERVVAGELVAVDVSLANVEALVSYGFTLNYETDKFEFVSVAPADEDLLKSTGGEIPMFFHHLVADGQVEVANGLVNGTAVSGGGDIVRFVFRVLREFEDNARFEIANGLVFDPTNLSNPAVVAGVLELQSTPREFALHQNFPNPFNPDTTIKYDLAESADVTLQIYNVLGQVVRTLVASEAQNAGRYQIRWNGMDDRGVPVSSGVYFYQISAEGKFHQVQKLMLLK